MHAIRQSIRPKHQVLVLKCYPKFQKNVVDVKPNSSELSYLLYYASTRRSKVQKVGAFLEEKTVKDVARGKIGDVQVTLQILKALIEKSPRDLPLYASHFIRILGTILRAKDINMVEETVPTLEASCTYEDVATLAPDQELMRQYEDIVKMYADFAAQNPSLQTKGPLSTPIAIRWRSAGLRAIKSIASSEFLGADGGRQLQIIMPTILQNLYSDDEEYLVALHQSVQSTEKIDSEINQRRRTSIATVQTVDTHAETNPAAVTGTTADADRLAEQEVGLLAMQSLKQIFVANNRGQIRTATSSMLKFIVSKVSTVPPLRPNTAQSSRSSNGIWATALMEMVTRWTPVQDRFIILVTTMETLVRSPVAEENLEQQLVLVTLVGWLLSSSINMIGLSVMDVLLGLVQHVLLLLQLGGRGSNVLPHHQQTDAIDLFPDTGQRPGQQSSTDGFAKTGHAVDVSSPSATRHELLHRLQRCIGDLGTHIYYSDQISDMISAIFLRLKPSPLSGISTATAAIEDPAAAAQAISASVNLKEDPTTDEFFSFGTARITALKAITEILTVANMKGSVAGAAAIGRNRVSIQVWEGTQWLLRDEDRRVRRAYVDALLTWLRLEMSKNDLRVMEDKQKSSMKSLAKTDAEGTDLPRRAISTASRGDKHSKPVRSTFLQLLHLAVYDNAVEASESDSDIMLLHLLLFHLVEKLGVNGAKSGLPMMMRLQEDINNDSIIPTSVGKLNVGSLVHGYLWTLSEKFDLDTSRVGQEIYYEILRRKEHKLWLDGIRIPPLPLDQTVSPKNVLLTSHLPLPILQQNALWPFDSRAALVEQIAISYANSVASPPTSPPSSPGRTFTMPILTSGGPSSALESELPSQIREEMLSDWTKELCIASIEKESTRTLSVSGSRSGTTRSGHHNLLAVDGQNPTSGTPTGRHSPAQSPTFQHNHYAQQPHKYSNAVSAAHSVIPPLQTHEFRLRRSSVQDNESPTPISSSDHNPVVRVDDLKRVLSGAFSNNKTRTASPLRHSVVKQDIVRTPSASVSSESMVSAEGFESASEGGYISRPTMQEHSNQADTSTALAAEYTGPRPWLMDYEAAMDGADENVGRGTTQDFHTSAEDPEANAKALKGEIVRPRSGGGELEDDVPPVPPLPLGVTMHHVSGLGTRSSERSGRVSSSDGRLRDTSHAGSQSEGTRSITMAKPRGVDKRRVVDIGALLGGIEVGSEKASNGMGRPPY
ncbi:MAG: hypothetical protein FRX48_05594 [Lasallia pustulata]|uniref:Protein efr3 n=1 Tax=Lasallia pustulata TaxID=136370 RepID=A0A5M8PMH7_9LECA|nr:MAG: hypothetical protein FRX48_05594 [Lasallia pustulata]